MVLPVNESFQLKNNSVLFIHKILSQGLRQFEQQCESHTDRVHFWPWQHLVPIHIHYMALSSESILFKVFNFGFKIMDEYMIN